MNENIPVIPFVLWQKSRHGGLGKYLLSFLFNFYFTTCHVIHITQHDGRQDYYLRLQVYFVYCACVVVARRSSSTAL